MISKGKKQQIPLGEISVEDVYSSPLYSDKRQFCLYPPNVPISQAFLDRLSFWGITTLEIFQTDDLNGLDFDIQTLTEQDSAGILKRHKENTEKAKALYLNIVEFTAKSYRRIQQKEMMAASEPQKSIRSFITEIRSIGTPILRFGDLADENTEYIIQHSVNSFILCVILGLTNKLPPHQLINLATAAMFHEIGLLEFPNYGKVTNLSAEEKEKLKLHVSKGVHILQDPPYQFNTEILNGILQHHERLDGTGYPYGIYGGQISNVGKFLGIACSYAAMISSQKFRKAYLPYIALMNLIRSTSKGYDPNILRSLLMLLSLYPIGSYVCLSDNSTGRVIDNNPGNPRFPTVELLLNSEGRPFNSPLVLKTSPQISIKEILTEEQVVHKENSERSKSQ